MQILLWELEDQKLGSSVSVTIIATGFGADQQHQIVNTEAKKIIHTLEEDQTLEHDLMGGEENHNTFEMTETEPSIENYKNEIEGNQSQWKIYWRKKNYFPYR